MYLIDLKSKIQAKRSETANALINVSSPNPSEYRYLQGFIHAYDKVIYEIDAMMKDVGEDD